MAHADYHCCAYCDKKLGHANGGYVNAKTKEDLCESCQRALIEDAGVHVYSGHELQAFIETRGEARIKGLIQDMPRPFRFCHYENAVDAAMAEKMGRDSQDRILD